MKEEFCIMPPSKFYSTKRYPGLERHECLEGRTGNRNKSIEDGLVIFLPPENHRTGKDSVHLAPKKWLWLKELAEKTWCEYYSKKKEDFRKKVWEKLFVKYKKIDLKIVKSYLLQTLFSSMSLFGYGFD